MLPLPTVLFLVEILRPEPPHQCVAADIIEGDEAELWTDAPLRHFLTSAGSHLSSGAPSTWIATVGDAEAVGHPPRYRVRLAPDGAVEGIEALPRPSSRPTAEAPAIVDDDEPPP